MSEANLLLLTQFTLKEQALKYQHIVPDHYKIIFSTPYSISLNDLSDCYHTINLKNSDMLVIYLLALITLKVTEESPLPNNQGLEYFEIIKNFINSYPDYSTNIMKTYFSAVIREISASDDLASWMKKLITFYDLDNETQLIKQYLKIRLSSKVNSFLVKIHENLLKSEIFEIIDLLVLGLQYKIDLNELVNLTASIILEKIITENEFKKYPGQKVEGDFNETREILNKIKTFQVLNQDNQEKTQFIEEKIGVLPRSLPKYQKKPKRDFQIEELIYSNVNLNELKIESTPFYSRDAGNFRVLCYYAIFSDNQKLVKKTYLALNDNADFTYIKNEIDILTVLSNISTPTNGFLKFYGSTLNNKVADLYMEIGGISLMNELTNYKNKNQRVEPFLAEKWIISLINIFAELCNRRIYHRDIKPHNILVKFDKTLKIIDFGVSIKTDECETMLITMENPIQGTKGYMAPELQDNLDKGIRIAIYKAGKADVFSLGLTILQILTFNNYDGFNRFEKNKELHEKVDMIIGYPEWIKTLIHKMLHPNRKERISFTKCLQYIQFDTKYFSTINN
ncbi:hypothetical protein SteCoe_28115 [Stentor coeruleus]|uniref:Protein kinase domain-containing protein n=1 Tax=Stentor coeruleus TaxID=5963 RepID=A0A1R2B8X6_9CILI|nr:hypothetical protein SteCoe_28115 [Stentor coeruleus]